jgi:hypothetical protein
MIKFNQYFNLLTEGGAAGHMLHPFDLEGVNKGKDLIRVFEDSVSHIAMKSAATKVDGTNNSLRLVNGPNGKEFALDRGSMKDIDLEGITIDRLEEKWPPTVDVGHDGTVTNEPHGMVKSGQIILGIMNEALPFIEAELKALKMWEVVPATESRFLNTEFVEHGGTNVVKYGKNFITFHGISKFKHHTGANPKTGRQINRREGSEVSDKLGNVKYNVNAFNRLVDKVHAISKKKDFDTHGVIPVRFTGQPDFASVLDTEISILRVPGEVDTKTLDIWLSIAKNPYDSKVTLVDGKKIPAMRKEVYQHVIGDDNRSVAPLTDKFEDSNVNIKLATDAAIFWHATKLLGTEVNRNLETLHNETVPVGEGIVIRGLKSGGQVHPLFKIVGEFIVSGLLSNFK